MGMTISQQLDKTRESIRAHIARGQGLGFKGNINRRGCELADRYDDLKANHNHGEEYSNEWKSYCDKRGLDYSHTGRDLFA